jgi:hypothetical protein
MKTMGCRFNSMSLKEAALEYARLGFKVFPLYSLVKPDGYWICSCGQGEYCKSPGKHPRTHRGLLEASANKKQIAEWWRMWPGANIGLCTGDGLVVIDVDEQSKAEYLRNYANTLASETGNGYHVFYRTDRAIKNSVRKVGDHTDIRGEGGYIVAPPSLHYSGKQYQFLNDLEIAELPDGLIPEEPPQAQTQAPSQIEEIIISENPNLEESSEGNRHEFLVREAGRMRRFGYGEEIIYAALSQLNSLYCKPPKSDKDIRKIARTIQRYSPSETILGVSDTQTVPNGQKSNGGQGKRQNKAFDKPWLMTLGEYMLYIFEQGDQIIHELYPGELSQMIALPNRGKSTLANNLAMALACGRPFPPFTTSNQPQKVCIIDFENRRQRAQNDWWTMRKVLNGWEASQVDENLHVGVDLELDDQPLKITQPKHADAIEKYLYENQIKFCVFDTLAAAARLTDENSNSEMQARLIDPLNRIASRCGAAIMLLHHTSKTSGDQDTRMMKARGASSLPGAVRLGIDLEAIPNCPNLVEVHCSKVKGQAFDPVLMELDRVTRWYSITQQTPAQVKSLADEILEFITDNGGKLPFVEIEGNFPGATKRTLQDKLKELVDAGKLSRPARGIYAV